MPEGLEVPTETLTDQIHEEVEREGGALFLGAAATALFAVTLLGGWR